MRAMAMLLFLAMAGCGGERAEGNIPAGDSPQVLVAYRCEADHTHREFVEAWPNSEGVLMPATEAGNQIECFLPGAESEVEP